MTSLELHLAADHPSFAGHFPGHPIAPGVLLLTLAQQAIEAATGRHMQGLAQCKFVAPTGPGLPLTLAYELRDGSVPFELRSDATLLASGRFICASAA